MPASRVEAIQPYFQLSQAKTERREPSIANDVVKTADELSVNDDLSSNKAPLIKDTHVFHTVSKSAPSSSNSESSHAPQAASYNRVGASVAEKNYSVIGSLLDVHI